MPGSLTGIIFSYLRGKAQAVSTFEDRFDDILLELRPEAIEAEVLF